MDQARFAQAGIDVQDGLKRFNGNEVLFITVLKVFLQDTSFVALKSALESDDFVTAGEKAHALKGAAGNLGLTVLYNLSIRFMALVKDGKREEARTLYPAIAAAHEKACQTIRAL